MVALYDINAENGTGLFFQLFSNLTHKKSTSVTRCFQLHFCSQSYWCGHCHTKR